MPWDNEQKRQARAARGSTTTNGLPCHPVGRIEEDEDAEFYLHRLSFQETIDIDPEAWGQDEQHAERSGRELDEHTAAIARQEAQRRH